MLLHEPITVKIYMSQENCHLPPKPITLPELDGRNASSKLPGMQASFANKIAHLHSLSMTDLLAQAHHLSHLPLIKSILLKKSPELRKFKPLGQPTPHAGHPFDALAAAIYKKAETMCTPCRPPCLKNIESSAAFHPILSSCSHPY